MKTTGITRNVDELGRIVLPIEIRRVFGIDVKTPMEIYSEGETIILQKYQSACLFCDSNKSIISFHGKTLCSDCLKNLKTLY